MEYNWTTSVFIAATVINVVMVLVAALVVVGCALYLAGGDDTPKEAANPIKSPQTKSPQIESSQNDANRLLQQIEANTRKTESNTAKTAFWTRVVGVPVLIGLIIGALASMAQCN
jgi:outer membrane PBP1 activator LpoA protein